jgi:hypothetical protein
LTLATTADGAGGARVDSGYGVRRMVRPVVALTIAVVGTIVLAAFLVGVVQSYTVDPYAPTTDFVKRNVNVMASASENMTLALDTEVQNYSLISNQGRALSALSESMRIQLLNYTYVTNASQTFGRILTTYKSAGDAFALVDKSLSASANQRFFATGIQLQMQADLQLAHLKTVLGV